MKVHFVGPDGMTTDIDVGDITPEDLAARLAPTVGEARLKALLASLKLSRSVKDRLLLVKKCTLKLGKRVIHVGIKVLELIVLIAMQFREIPVALLIGTILYLLLSSIPIIGHLLGALAFTVAMALGFSKVLVRPDDVSKPTAERIQAKIDELFKDFKSWCVPEPASATV